MKGFSTRSAGEGALGDAFVVGFQVTVENRFVCETLETAFHQCEFVDGSPGGLGE